MSIILHIKNQNQPLINLFFENWKKGFVEQSIRRYRCELGSPTELAGHVFEDFQKRILEGELSQSGLSDEDVKYLLTKLSDRQLIVLLSSQNHRFTMDYLYKAHLKMFLQRAIYKFKTQRENGEGAYHDAFIAFFENARDGKLTKLTTDYKWYFCKIFDHKIINIINKKNNKPTYTLDTAEANKESSYNTFESTIEQQAQKQKATSLLHLLDEECRKLLVLFFYNGYDMDSIARELNYANANSAKSKKYKCLQKLIKLMRGGF